MAVRKRPDFRRAATQRLSTAEFLFSHGLHLDAMYLGGYAIECALKALVLARTPAGRRPAKFEEISQGKKGHDFEFLAAELRHTGCRMPLPVGARLRLTSVWTTDWRYRVGLGEFRDAAAFLHAVRIVRDWVERSL